MTEAEYDLMLDIVTDAIEWSPQDNGGPDGITAMRRAANDNQKEWKLEPFPAGWNASC